jgi:hypothetical protein
LTGYRSPFVSVQLLPKYIEPEEYEYAEPADVKTDIGAEEAGIAPSQPMSVPLIAFIFSFCSVRERSSGGAARQTRHRRRLAPAVELRVQILVRCKSREHTLSLSHCLTVSLTLTTLYL